MAFEIFGYGLGPLDIMNVGIQVDMRQSSTAFGNRNGFKFS